MLSSLWFTRLCLSCFVLQLVTNMHHMHPEQGLPLEGSGVRFTCTALTTGPYGYLFPPKHLTGIIPPTATWGQGAMISLFRGTKQVMLL